MRSLACVLALGLALSFAACTPKEGVGEDGTVPAPPDVAAPPADAIKTPSGLASKMIRVGLGRDHPGPRSRVLVHYTGWTTDGKMFDTSLRTGGPVTMPLEAVIPGWTEGIQLMVPGEKRRFWIPAKLAYGETPPAGMPKGMLVFDVELLEIR